MMSNSLASNVDSEILHPAKNPDLKGQQEAEQALLDAYNSSRLAHAWLLTGPKGIGKATLAYRFARFLLVNGNGQDDGGGLFGAGLPPEMPENLYVAPEMPVFQRVSAGGHADLKSIERTQEPKSGRLRSSIVIDDVRSIGSFLSLTSAEGGWRVVIIDSADEMNRSSANAVLKVLEEPPRKAILLLVSHNPGRLLPTIRSRCRNLTMKPLPKEDVVGLLLRQYPDISDTDALELATLSDGSVGRALELQEVGGLALYRELLSLLQTLPNLKISAVHDLAGRLGRAGQDEAFQTFSELIRGWLNRYILTASRGGTGTTDEENALFQRLMTTTSLESWYEVWEKINHLLERTDAVNLDKKQVVIGIFLALQGASKP